MSTTLNVVVRVNGQLTDLDAAVLADAGNVFGVKRVDGGAVVVAAGTSISRLSLGTYQHVFTDTGSGHTYTISLKLTYNGTARYYTRTVAQDGVSNQSYLIPASNHFTSEAEVTRLLGVFAVQMALEDWTTSTFYVWEDILTAADSQIALYINQYYVPEDNYANSYLRRAATYFAAADLSKRRGNPGLYVQEVQEFKDQLDDIRMAKIRIPGAIPLGNTGPVVRNQKMQPLRLHPMRVESSKSMGDHYAHERVAYLTPYLYCSDGP